MTEATRGTGAPDVDVVVAGAGGAGLAAALAAAQCGLDVLVVEAKETFPNGCNTVLSTAMIPAGGSRWQAAAGITDSPQRFYDDVQRKAHGEAEPAVARTLTAVAPRLVNWLADHVGIELELVTDFDYPGHTRPRCHSVPDRSGRTLHRGLLKAATRESHIDVVAPRRMSGLIVSSAGQVVGARLEAPRGEPEDVRSRAVVLATNGFGADRALVRRHVPEIAEGLYFGGDGSTGDALRLGEEVGADVACLDAYQGHGSVATPQGVLVTWATVMHGAVIVNTDGVRFGNEAAGYSEFAQPVLQQPGQRAWVVFDSTVDSMCHRFADYQRCLEMSAVRWTPDVGGLAELIGAPEPSLRKTLSEAAACADTGATDRFGRTHWERHLIPPYAAVRVTGALFHTQGGLQVDDHAAVLRQGQPVPGLYAAGGAAVGMSGHGAAGYLAGNGLLAALGLGYVAGVSAAGRPWDVDA